MLLQLVTQKVSVHSVIFIVTMFQFQVFFFFFKLYRRQKVRSTSKRLLLPCKQRLFRYVRSKYDWQLTQLLSCLNLAKVKRYSLASFRIGRFRVCRALTSDSSIQCNKLNITLFRVHWKAISVTVCPPGASLEVDPNCDLNVSPKRSIK